MKIAVTSQNRTTVTEHAGRCRNFWLFEVQDKAIVGRSLLELEHGQSLHDAHDAKDHPLDGIDVLIAGGMGQGLVARMAARGVQALVTTEQDPQAAVLAFLDGSLAVGAPHDHAHEHGAQADGRGGCGGCGCH